MSSRRSLVVATDATIGDTGTLIAMADTRGQWAIASTYPQTVHSGTAEATALKAAIDTAPTNRGLHLITDSMNTVNLLRTALRGTLTNDGDRFDIIRAVARTARARTAPTVIHWVPGHDGNAAGAAVLHAATDRLANRAGRDLDTVLEENIVSDYITARRKTTPTIPRAEADCTCNWVAPRIDHLHVDTIDDLTIYITPRGPVAA